jgi:hypothetical protein
VNGAIIGGVVSARLSVCAAVVSLVAEGKAAAAPRAAVVMGMMGFLKALKKAGVPNVSVRAIARTFGGTCQRGSCVLGRRFCSYPFAKASNPIPKSKFIRFLIVVSNGGNAHVPLVRNRPHWCNAVFHGKVDVASSRELALEAALFGGPHKPFDDQIVCVIISPPPGTKIGHKTASFKQSFAFGVCLFFLTLIVPVCIAELKVGFTGKSKEGNFVENGFNPTAANSDVQVAVLGLAQLCK